MHERIMKTLEQINWDFSDYNSAKYPLDINSIHWYLATFPPLIPMYLISLLSDENDVVYDPFGGAGTTSIEAVSLNRRFIYNDLNPFAVDILISKIAIIRRSSTAPNFLHSESDMLQKYALLDSDVESFIIDNRISEDVWKWYHPRTLNELCSVLKLVYSDPDADELDTQIRRCAFSAILKDACSQTDHVTYITDNCWPKKLIYRNAAKLYLDQINLIRLSALEFHKRYEAFFGNESNVLSKIDQSIVYSNDSREMSWLDDNSVDLVVTSPPYLCAQDYAKTMRLTNHFFQNERYKQAMEAEIGPRRKRGSNSQKTVQEYYLDMGNVFSEIHRVLRPNKYFCLVIGQGSGKTTEPYNIVGDIEQELHTKYDFKLEYMTERNISSRRIHVGGVKKESIFVFKKMKGC